MLWLMILAFDVTGTSAGNLKKLEQADLEFIRAYTLYAQAQLDEAAKIFQDLHASFPREPVGAVSAYNAAFLLSRLGRSEESLRWLEKAFDAGYDNFQHVESDGDLAATRALPKYAEVLERAKKRITRTRAPIRPLQCARFARMLVEAGQTGDWIKSYALSSRLGWFAHAPTVEALNRLLSPEGFQITCQNGAWRVEKIN
jgi:tetratricopeptide (TPR) repeat protein